MALSTKTLAESGIGARTGLVVIAIEDINEQPPTEWIRPNILVFYGVFSYQLANELSIVQTGRVFFVWAMDADTGEAPIGRGG